MSLPDASNDLNELEKLTIPLLKERCRALGLPVSGKKGVLVSRIQEALASKDKRSSTSIAPSGEGTVSQPTKARKEKSAAINPKPIAVTQIPPALIQTPSPVHDIQISQPIVSSRANLAPAVNVLITTSSVAPVNQPESQPLETESRTPTPVPTSISTTKAVSEARIGFSYAPLTRIATSVASKAKAPATPKSFAPLAKITEVPTVIQPPQIQTTSQPVARLTSLVSQKPTVLPKRKLPPVTPDSNPKKHRFKPLIPKIQAPVEQAVPSDTTMEVDDTSTLNVYVPEQWSDSKLPPLVLPVRHRARVQRLIVAFSLLDVLSLGRCERVCAIWKSAVSIIWQRVATTHFDDSRTSALISAPTRLNFKRYVLFRLNELGETIHTIKSTWYGRLCDTLTPYSTSVSPYRIDRRIFNDVKSAHVAMRFVMTRFFHMSQGRRDASILNAMGSVLDVEMVQGGEVAVVKVGGARCEDGRIINEAYLIACCNGEVISSVAGENSDAQAEIPEVWKEMLKASQCGGEGFLLGRISTGDVTKPRNIHKRVYASNFLRDVAERFVLAHLDPPLSFPVSKQLDAPIVSCVENVGRVNARGEKMVDELALVVTGDSGSVMVLKEIGQSIGTEGGDIRPLWQLLLKCDGGGRSLSKMNGGNVGDRTNYVRIGAEFCSRMVLPSRGWFEIVKECVEYVE